MYAVHSELGEWQIMTHGTAFLLYDRQNGSRGGEQVGSVNWGMLMAERAVGTGRLTLEGMMSLEPFTIRDGGYPLLLQSGEAYHGQPLHDRQHPHDLFMALAARYDQPLTRQLGVSLYVAPVGEPALGPVAFMHRPSAVNDPFATIGHHWQDATHVSFGVITAGLFTNSLKLEGSVFNGREPDENRTNFDYKGRSLDSYAGRLTVNPSPSVSLSASYGYLKSPEALEPDQSQHRIGASVLYAQPFGSEGAWESALIYGANKHSNLHESVGGETRTEPSRFEHSIVAETNLDLNGRNAVFGRAGYVQKSAGDLVVPGVDQHAVFDVYSLVAGYVREVADLGSASLGLGARGSLDVVPNALKTAYGTRTPTGVAVYVRIRPKRMKMSMRMDSGMDMGTGIGSHTGGHDSAKHQ